MSLRKPHKKDLKTKMKDQIGETIHNGKLPKAKEKYKHKNHWLEQDDDDDDYELPRYRDEEE